MKRFIVFLTPLAILLGGTCCQTQAGPISIAVFVGYADNLRPSPFFPSPFYGDANIVRSPNEAGNTATHDSAGQAYDSGAIRIDNTGTSNVTVTDVKVNGFHNGASFDIWGTNMVIGPGQSLLLTQTFGENFDSSDQSGGTPTHPVTDIPKVLVTTTDTVALTSTLSTFQDTGHVLDTGGFDLAGFPQVSADGTGNESFAWRPIGTFGGQPGVATPEPASLTLLGLGLAGLAGYGWRRRKA